MPQSPRFPMKTVHESSDGALISENEPRMLLHGYVLFSCVLLFIYCLYSPVHNWDMLGYAASVVSWQSDDPVYLHNHVYQELAEYVSNEDFEKLTVGVSYRETMYTDNTAFVQQIPYYKIRLIFISLIYVLVILGVGLYTACHVVSAAAAALGLIAFYYAYKSVVKPVLWILLPFLCVLSGVLDAGQTVTADSLAFLGLGLVCCAFTRDHWSVFPLLVVLILIRTDLAVFVALMLAYYFLFRPEFRFHCWITAIATVVAYIGVNKLSGNYGWSTVFYFVFVSDMNATHPDEFSILNLTARQYISAVANNLYPILYANEFRLFAANVLLQTILFLQLQKVNSTRREKLIVLTNDSVFVLTIMSCAYVVLHYLIFPVLWSRFFISQYMIASIGVLYAVSCLLERSQSMRIGPGSNDIS